LRLVAKLRTWASSQHGREAASQRGGFQIPKETAEEEKTAIEE